jgi:endogenous inhibitor of DNA gyrase (YacG/DUF329 family)
MMVKAMKSIRTCAKCGKRILGQGLFFCSNKCKYLGLRKCRWDTEKRAYVRKARR